MTNFTDLASVPSDPVVPFTDPLRLAAAAYLARFKGSSREHTESDLRCYLAWCAERHRVLRVCGKGTKVVLVPLPPAVGRAIDRAIASRVRGPILLNTRGARMDRHAATRQLHRLAEAAGIQTARTHPHMLRHTHVTTMLDAGADLRDVQIAARHADPPTTMRYDRPATAPAATPNTSWRLHGLRHLTPPPSPAAHAAGDARTLPMSERTLCGVAWHRRTPVLLR